MAELKLYKRAYIFISLVLVVLVVSLWGRYQLSGDMVTKDDLQDLKVAIVNEVANTNSQKINELIDAINNLINEIRVDRNDGEK